MDSYPETLYCRLITRGLAAVYEQTEVFVGEADTLYIKPARDCPWSYRRFGFIYKEFRRKRSKKS